MNPFDPSLLDADAAQLDAAESDDASWDFLVGLRAAGLHRAADDLPDLDRIEAWAKGAEDPDVLAAADRSLLMAELLEESIEIAPAVESGPRRLVASTAFERPPEPFPAVYGQEDWSVVVGLDERDHLFVALDQAPPGADATVLLPDVDRVLQLPAGGLVSLGAAEDLLGVEPSFNPVRSLRVRLGVGPWTTLWRVPEA